MKKKVLLLIAIFVFLLSLLAISASAANMANYCTVKLTLTSGETVTAYCGVSGDRMQRDALYKTPDPAGEKYDWGDVVVFDCRDQEIVGVNTPKSWAGTGCNDYAKNVTTVYLSDYFTYFLNTTFTSGWESLETVYISSSVTDIKGFGGSPVKNVIIAENPSLKTVGADAFNNCTKLESINLKDCKSLKTISSNAFRNCTGLKTITLPEGLEEIGRNGFHLSGLSGKIVVPNSVTVLDAGAFLSTNIETLVLGDGVVSIGYNFLGTLSSANNAYLKNVYLSDETVFTDKSIFYKSIHPVHFYIVGENCDEVKEALLSQSAAIGSTLMTFVLAEDATENMGAGYGIIHTGYNRCDAFYDETHLFDTENVNDVCLIQCERCKETVASGGPHSLSLVESYLGDRYITGCTVENLCSACGFVESKAQFGAIVKWLGYSVAEFSASGAVSMGQFFSINQKELASYCVATGKSVSYGVVVAANSTVSPVNLENGVARAVDGALLSNLTGIDAVEIKITLPVEKANAFLIFSGFITDGVRVDYINDNSVTDSAIAMSYIQLNSLENID